MKIFLKKPPSNITLFMRRLGYHPDKWQKSGRLSFSKRIGGSDYPKFHIYINKEANRSPTPANFFLNLHIDMKKPSYKGSSAHSGEYDSDLVKQEATRIENTLP
jgi:hypothetical protein